MVVCKKCGRKNFEISKTCEKCGAALHDEDRYAFHLGQMMEVNSVPRKEKQTQTAETQPKEKVGSIAPPVTAGAVKAKKGKFNEIKLATSILMVLTTLTFVMLSLVYFVSGVLSIFLCFVEVYLIFIPIIFFFYGLVALVPLVFYAFMTVYYFLRTFKGKGVGVVFKICTLLLMNASAGILMLCDKEQTKKLDNADPSISELKKYKELFDNGVIAEEEFNFKKKQILGM